MYKFLVGLIATAILSAVSWAICARIVFLICLCFSLEFNLSIATGIWLIIILIRLFFSSGKKH